MVATRGDVNELAHDGRNGTGCCDAVRARDTCDSGNTIDASDEVVDPLDDEQGNDQMIH